MKLENLLESLEFECTRDAFSRMAIIAAIENVLLWLNQPDHNTNENCRSIDYFVTNKIILNRNFDKLSEEIRSLLFDMGGTLHDAHTSPEISANFDSMPEQLLERVKHLR